MKEFFVGALIIVYTVPLMILEFFGVKWAHRKLADFFCDDMPGCACDED